MRVKRIRVNQGLGVHQLQNNQGLKPKSETVHKQQRQLKRGNF